MTGAKAAIDRPVLETGCCIVGGGPAGMMAGYLFARAGVPTVVLEKHADFLRDFRGDTVHPSTLEIIRDLGLVDRFLQRPHDRLEAVAARIEGRTYRVADFSRLPTASRFIAFMPQWEFLDFLADEGRRLSTFDLRMRWSANDIVEKGGRVAGVVADTPAGPVEIRAGLVIGADGRRSVVRERAGLKVVDLGAPIDVLWFSVPRDTAQNDDTLLHAAGGNIVVTIDRGDYWQCAYLIPKGHFESVKAKGIAEFRASIARTAPHIAPHVAAIDDWRAVHILTVKVDRLETWSRPGLLMIGDAAHAMSPIGGIGINLAIQDAVAAANLFARDLASGRIDDQRLDALRRRRLLPTRLVQAAQLAIQDRLIDPIIKGGNAPLRPPLPLRLLDALPPLRGLAARFLGLGLRREKVTSPKL